MLPQHAPLVQQRPNLALVIDVGGGGMELDLESVANAGTLPIGDEAFVDFGWWPVKDIRGLDEQHNPLMAGSTVTSVDGETGTVVCGLARQGSSMYGIAGVGASSAGFYAAAGATPPTLDPDKPPTQVQAYLVRRAGGEPHKP